MEGASVVREMEGRRHSLVPDVNRGSAGRSEWTAGLPARLLANREWGEPVYMEGYHTERMSRARYLGIWRSVNDVQQQAGPERFQNFLDYIEDRLSGHDEVDAVDQTRLWAVQRA